MTDATDTKTWATAVSRHENNGRMIIFRFVRDFGPGFDRLSQPVRIILAWKYDSETGMPVSDEREQMDTLEDAIEAHVEKDGFANLVLVSTGENLREWTCYAASEDGFLLRLNSALSNHPRYPIDIHISEDPAWDMYEKFRRELVE